MAGISPKKWAEVRAAYRRGEGSQRELAARFGIHASSIARRALKEHWEQERGVTQEAAQTKAAERDVESLASMLTKHRRLAKRILELAERKLEDAAAGKRNISVNALDQVSLVVARAIPVERLAAGVERVKPVKPVEVVDGDEIVFEIDAPDDEEAVPAAAPVKAP